MTAQIEIRRGPDTLRRSGGRRVRPGRTLTGHPLAGSRTCTFVHVRQHVGPSRFTRFHVYSRGQPYTRVNWLIERGFSGKVLMNRKRTLLTKHIGFRVKESAFADLERLAESDGKLVNDWCRDRLLGFLALPTASPAGHALLAEIAATQSITTSLLFAFARDGKLPETKVREILERARKDKFTQAAELLRQASISAPPSDSDSEPKTRFRA